MDEISALADSIKHGVLQLAEENAALRGEVARLREAVEWAERNYRAVMLDYDGPFLECVSRAIKRHLPDHPIYSRRAGEG